MLIKLKNGGILSSVCHACKTVSKRRIIIFLVGGLIIYLLIWRWNLLTSMPNESSEQDVLVHGISVSPLNISTPNQMVLRYNRAMTTGLGDRLMVMLSVAALARALNTRVAIYWYELIILKYSNVLIHIFLFFIFQVLS